jgi:pyrimidine-specific ribonucleoside hydrolase
MDLLFDMETQDPDDALTLCLLATHPAVRLVGVTVNPGTRAQIAVVRHLCARAGRPDVPIGARNPDADRDAVSPFHTDWLGPLAPAAPDAEAHVLLAQELMAHPAAVLLTGAPLHNLRLLLNRHPDARIARWVAQGGFAGDALVDPAHRLPKFAGRLTCPTFNFNGDPKATLAALASDRIGSRDLVSKNVTHGIAYDAAFHARLGPYRDRAAGIALVHEAMTVYLAGRPEGKLLHDPLAACVAIDRTIATWREVEVYREHGEWGARAAAGTRTFITVAADRERFFATLVGDMPTARVL